MVYILDLKITQVDCPHASISRKFKDLNILILNTSITPEGYQRIFSIFYSNEKGTVENAFNEFISYNKIKDVEVISKKENIISAIYSMPQTSAFSNLSSKGFRLHPIKVSMGQEEWFYVYYNDYDTHMNFDFVNDTSTKLLKGEKLSTNEFFERYISIFSEIGLIDMLSNLDSRDIALFYNALNMGYFDWPRKVNLSELSAYSTLSKSTLSYHLRKIEKVIFQNINRRFKTSQ